jgi:hypothetical protein
MAPLAVSLFHSVALIGFSRTLQRSGYGILYRSGLDPVVLPDPARALRLLEHALAFDALVLDVAQPRMLMQLDRFVSLPVDPQPVVVIVYQGRLMPARKAWLVAAGARCLAWRDFTFRRVAWHIRDALRLPTDNHPRVERWHARRTR